MVGRLLSFWESENLRGYVSFRQGKQSEHMAPKIGCKFWMPPKTNPSMPKYQNCPGFCSAHWSVLAVFVDAHQISALSSPKKIFSSIFPPKKSSKRCTGKCLTRSQLLICSSFSREISAHPVAHECSSRRFAPVRCKSGSFNL